MDNLEDEYICFQETGNQYYFEEKKRSVILPIAGKFVMNPVLYDSRNEGAAINLKSFRRLL